VLTLLVLQAARQRPTDMNCQNSNSTGATGMGVAAILPLRQYSLAHGTVEFGPPKRRLGAHALARSKGSYVKRHCVTGHAILTSATRFRVAFRTLLSLASAGVTSTSGGNVKLAAKKEMGMDSAHHGHRQTPATMRWMVMAAPSPPPPPCLFR